MSKLLNEGGVKVDQIKDVEETSQVLVVTDARRILFSNLLFKNCIHLEKCTYTYEVGCSISLRLIFRTIIMDARGKVELSSTTFQA